ncbi:MAG: hypothetical protein ACRDEA_15695 [Microcystaceae cyanobacterium]
MDKFLLEKFRKAYQSLELFPLITARQIEAFELILPMIQLLA